MADTLNTVQKKHLNEVVRPGLERMVAIWYDCDALVKEIDNQLTAIPNTTDVLHDDPNRDAPRSDAPELQGVNVTQLRDFAANIRDEIGATGLDGIIKRCVRPVSTIMRT